MWRWKRESGSCCAERLHERESFAMAGAKILVVDDDAGLRTLMKVRLEAAGYTVTLAEGGVEALARATEEVYELAIVDLKMEGMDGITLLGKLLGIHPTL